MLERAKRASHIDPPASSYAIMRRARPYRGENHRPGKDFHTMDPARIFTESLTPRPELENSQGHLQRFEGASAMSASHPDCVAKLESCRASNFREKSETGSNRR